MIRLVLSLLMMGQTLIQSGSATVAGDAAGELATGEHAALYGRFTPQMKMALSEEAVSMLAGQLFGAAGVFEGIETAPACRAVQGVDACVVALTFERSLISVQIAVNPEGRVAGLFLVGNQPRPAQGAVGTIDSSSDVVGELVARLDLEQYKATLRELTRFGDRRAGTARNRAVVDWIEARLASYGCATERLTYEVPLPEDQRQAYPGGGGRRRGVRAPTSVNRDPQAQPDVELRELNSGPVIEGPRDEVFCTKTGATRPDEMYIVGAHMDGIGWGEAANDDGSGTALVLELARILNSPDVRTERSIRFILFNDEESGLLGSQAYVAQRRGLQGIEDPAGSGRYPEPRWLGMVQHDMMLFDHGMPLADETLSPRQRPEADVNIEFQESAPTAAGAMDLAWAFQRANEAYATDYPATIGSHMSNTDSAPFATYIPAISLRENERITEIGNGWDPHWHQATDVFETFGDDDFRLGLNAAETTLGAIGRLAGATLIP